MKLLTRRQEEIWRKKMIDIERRLIGYYDSHPGSEPDGSFAMSAFTAGYYLRGISERKAKK
jgi:hypothetical protein